MPDTNISPPNTFEPPHDKTNKMTVRLAKTQITLGICPVWSESLLCAKWVAKGPRFLHADSEDSDQTGQMPRLSWVFAGHTVILLVLSWGGSFGCILQCTYLLWCKMWLPSCRKTGPQGKKSSFTNELPHDKTSKMTCPPSDDSDQLGHLPSLIRVSLCAQWVAKDPSFLHADSENSDQTVRMPRLIWVFVGRTCHFVCFVSITWRK